MTGPGVGTPRVVGLTVAAALAAAELAGTDVVVQQQQAASSEDIVEAQIPGPGERLRPGARLWVWIAGTTDVEMPHI